MTSFDVDAQVRCKIRGASHSFACRVITQPIRCPLCNGRVAGMNGTSELSYLTLLSWFTDQAFGTSIGSHVYSFNSFSIERFGKGHCTWLVGRYSSEVNVLERAEKSS